MSNPAHLDGIRELQAQAAAEKAQLRHDLGPNMVDTAVAAATKGYWRDIIRYPDGTEVVTDWNHNLVVNTFANLAAALTLGNGAGGLGTTYAGVQYMAVGTGQASWDTNGVPAPALTDIQLVAEIGRKVVSCQFVDSIGNVVAGPVNTILVSCTFNVGEVNGSLREWGLFGGNATATVNSGIMIDHVTNAALTKNSGAGDFSLTRLVTLVF